MAGDHLHLGVDQNRDIEPEALDAPRNLSNLFWTMHTRVTRVELQLGDSSPNYGGCSMLIVEFSLGSVGRPFRFHPILPLPAFVYCSATIFLIPYGQCNYRTMH
jgi:hypothetical protein